MSIQHCFNTDNDKDTLKRCGEQWKKIKDFIISTSKTSDSYDKKYMKIKFNSDDNLPLKMTELMSQETQIGHMRVFFVISGTSQDKFYISA